jgi:hypothetical protein
VRDLAHGTRPLGDEVVARIAMAMTACLQTVRTAGPPGAELGAKAVEAAWSDFDRPGRVARAWHGPRTALRRRVGRQSADGAGRLSLVGQAGGPT